MRKSGFSIDCSMVRSPNGVLTPLKGASHGNAFGNVGSTFQNLRLGGVTFDRDLKVRLFARLWHCGSRHNAKNQHSIVVWGMVVNVHALGCVSDSHHGPIYILTIVRPMGVSEK